MSCNGFRCETPSAGPDSTWKRCSTPTPRPPGWWRACRGSGLAAALLVLDREASTSHPGRPPGCSPLHAEAVRAVGDRPNEREVPSVAADVVDVDGARAHRGPVVQHADGNDEPEIEREHDVDRLSPRGADADA